MCVEIVNGVIEKGECDFVEELAAPLPMLVICELMGVPLDRRKRMFELTNIMIGMDDPELATTEEEGIALLAGAWLGGERGVLLMQSSGVGNCINMLALTHECRFPLLMLITMRGQSGESNPWQVPMGQATGSVLREMGVIVHPVDDSAQLGATVAAVGRQAFDTNGAAAVLIAQSIVGFKNFVAGDED